MFIWGHSEIRMHRINSIHVLLTPILFSQVKRIVFCLFDCSVHFSPVNRMSGIQSFTNNKEIIMFLKGTGSLSCLLYLNQNKN